MEAILWALGAPLSTLRVTNLNEIVNSGSENGLVSVTVTFKNNNLAGYDKTFYRVSATLWGHRKPPLCVHHQIGGKNVSLKDLHAFLQAIRVNVLEPRFVIFQNKCATIINAGPPQLSRSISDAAGTLPLLDSIEVAQKKLQKWKVDEANIGVKTSSLQSILEVDLKSLKSVERLTELDSKIELAGQQIVNYNRMKEIEEAKSQQEELNSLNSVLTSRNAELSAIESHISELAIARDDAAESLRVIESEYRSSNEQMRLVQADEDAKSADLKALVLEREELLKERASLRRAVVDAEAKLIELRTEEAAAEEDVAAAIARSVGDTYDFSAARDRAAKARVEVVRLASILQSKKSTMLQSTTGRSAHEIKAEINQLHMDSGSTTVPYSRTCDGDLGPFGDHVSFKDGHIPQDLPAVLDAASGWALRTCVVARSSSVSHKIMDQWGTSRPGWRVWSLDRLKPMGVDQIRSKIQNAQKKYSTVVTPLDYLRYEKDLRIPAELAFGKYAIAPNDAIAARVCLEYGVTCFSAQTLTRHDRGQVVGGTVPRSKAGLMAMKFKKTNTTARIAALNRELDILTDAYRANIEIEALETELSAAKSVMELTASDLAAYSKHKHSDVDLHKQRLEAEARLSEAQLGLSAHEEPPPIPVSCGSAVMDAMNQHADIASRYRAARSLVTSIKSAITSSTRKQTQMKQNTKTMTNRIVELTKILEDSGDVEMVPVSTLQNDAQRDDLSAQILSWKAESRDIKRQVKTNVNHVLVDQGFRELEVLQEKSNQIKMSVTLINDAINECRVAMGRLEAIVFEAIQREFSTMFSELVPTKQAGLMMVDKSLHNGIVFQVNDGIARLSGGESVLMAISFLLSVARQGSQPSFYIFDEIDAPLDESNGDRVSSLLKKLGIQVLAISHHEKTFEKGADRVFRLFKDHKMGYTTL